jgi:F-type H+-transporting ATPase subunit b
MLGIAIVHAAETAQATSSGGIGALGINLNAFLFQVVNFAILLFLLQRFAYRPILDMLETRRGEVNDSLKKVEAIAKREKAQKKEEEKILNQAASQAETIISESRDQAKSIITEAEMKATDRAKQLTAENEARLNREVEKLRHELKSEALHYIALATGRMLDEKVDSSKDGALMKRILTEAELEQKKNSNS